MPCLIPTSSRRLTADAALNLPDESYSHGLRALAATEVARGSFDEAVAALDRTTAVRVPKRQVENLARAVAVDFEAFVSDTDRPEPADDVLVLSVAARASSCVPTGCGTPPGPRPRTTS